jgi:hypothetical protein
MNITIDQFIDDLIQMYNTNEDGLYIDQSSPKGKRIENYLKKVCSIFIFDKENFEKITRMTSYEYVDFVNACIWECPQSLYSYGMNHEEEFSNMLNRNFKGRKKFISQSY